MVNAYGAIVASGAVASISFQAAQNLANRVIARAKTTALPNVPAAYLLTGRFRFTTTALNTWQNIKTFGTWQQVRVSKGTWLGVRGSASTTTPNFLSLFLTIVDPATGNDYIEPVQVMSSGEGKLNQWVDFSALIGGGGTTIPATAEIRLVHGTKVPEYATDWYLDEFGITPGSQWGQHRVLYWFDGDSQIPADAADYLYPGTGWTGTVADASISWAGTIGNSISLFYAPSTVTNTTTCQLDASDSAMLLPCEPVLLSDPVNVNLATWVGLIHLDALTYPSKQTVHQIINRAAPIAISQVRGWATGAITVLTMNAEARTKLLLVMASGRVLLVRNPVRDYPENDWYLACGDLVEDRPVPNQRVTVREWTFPFVRVERPSGLIEAASGATWQQVKDSGTWLNLRTTRQDWLAVLNPESVG
jgi:hypothetical protein